MRVIFMALAPSGQPSINTGDQRGDKQQRHGDVEGAQPRRRMQQPAGAAAQQCPHQQAWHADGEEDHEDARELQQQRWFGDRYSPAAPAAISQAFGLIHWNADGTKEAEHAAAAAFAGCRRGRDLPGEQRAATPHRPSGTAAAAAAKFTSAEPRPAHTSVSITENQIAMPNMCGMVARMPWLAAEAATITLFGPGVMYIATEKPSRESSVLSIDD